MEIHGTPLFMVGAMVTQIIARLEETNANSEEENTKIANEYMLQRLYEIKRDIDSALLEELSNSLTRIKEDIEGSDKEC